MAHSTLVVASSDDAPRIGAMGALDQIEYPHFHCGGLDAGIFGQVFWDVSEDKHQFSRDVGAMEALYSNEAESVVVHALPLEVLQRYGRLSDREIEQVATRWAQPNGHIRMPRSTDFYRPLMQEVARLARIAIREGKALMVRTQFRGAQNRSMQPTREDAPG